MASVPRLRSLDPLVRRRFQRSLLAWYRRHRRDLPWRGTRDPYHILVSEIMLQQTQVERVVPKYRQFLERYPTLEALAEAQPAAVRKLWYPLGYNVRPVHLHAIAREAVARYGGSLPEDGEALSRLPGVGRYTAGALLSFAFGRDAPLVDTNVRARPRPHLPRPRGGSGGSGTTRPCGRSRPRCCRRAGRTTGTRR